MLDECLVNLDWTKLLAFDQVEHKNNLGSVGDKIGAKVGDKSPVQRGTKIGAKPGIKNISV